MKRNKQKALYLAGALVATASLGFASQDAQADSLEEATVSTSETSATVTADQVATAKTEAKTAQDKLNQASQDLASAQANQADTQKALSDADKALQDAKNVDASSSAKAQAQDAVTSAQAQVTAQETVVEQNQTAVDNATQAYNDQKAITDQAELAVVEAKAQADADAKAVENISTSGVSVEDAQKAVDESNVEVSVAETNVSIAENAVAEAQAQDAQLAKDIEIVAGDVENAEDNLARTQSDAVNAQDSVNQAQSAVDAAQAELTEATKGQATWTIETNIPANVVEAIKGLTDTTDESTYQNSFKQMRAYLDTIPLDERTEAFDKLINVTINADDTVYDLNNLPETVRKQMNVFFVDVVNSIRQAVGLPEAVASEIVRQHAEMKADLYKEKYGQMSISTGLDHNSEIIDQADQKYGLSTNEQLGDMYSFDLKDGFTFSHNLDLSQLFSVVKKNIVNMILMDEHSNYGHLRGLLNSETLGIAVNPTIDGLGRKMSTVVITGANQLDTPAILKKFNPTEYERRVAKNAEIMTPIKLDQVVDTSAIQTKLVIANTALKASQEQLAEAEARVATAQKTLDYAKTRYDALTSQSSKLAEAQEHLTDAQNALASAKAKYATATANLEKAQADATSYTQALAQAKAKAEASQKALTSAQATAQTEATKLATAQVELDKAKAQASASQDSLFQAQNALATAKSNLERINTAQASLATAQANYDKAKAEADSAQEALAKAQANYQEAQSHADTAWKNYEALKLQYNLQNNQPITPVEPSKPVTPTEPTVPVEPTKPAVPTSPVTPEEPSKPEVPTTPEKPEEPTKPAVPTEPTVPVEPTKPAVPTTPEVPEEPTNPAVPTEPTAPVVTKEEIQSAYHHQITKQTTQAVVKRRQSSANYQAGVTANDMAYSRVALSQAQNQLPKTGEDQSVLVSLMGVVTLTLGVSVAGKQGRKD